MHIFRLLAMFLGTGAICVTGVSNPYPDPSMVPVDGASRPVSTPMRAVSAQELRDNAIPVMRVRVDWDKATDSFAVGQVVQETSGTPSLVARSRREDPLGSYKGAIVSALSGEVLAYDSIGTGQEFRKLTRALSFRFPVMDEDVVFVLVAENPRSGQMEEVIRESVEISESSNDPDADDEVEVRIIKEAETSPELVINIYAEGYTADRKSVFWRDAAKILPTFESYDMPMMDRLTVRAVFAPSTKSLGSANDLGLPVQPRDSFLGLYYPYWNGFGRWYHVVYPTSEEKYRRNLALVPYDYPIILVDSSSYWGVGNYRELTAIPAHSSSFSYLLMHEFGHFMGLNEEYESGGKTELAFAPGIEEPWSQNITFLRDPTQLKWQNHVRTSTPVPTPRGTWGRNGPYGAYKGGYAQTEPFNTSHKPGYSCTMESAGAFCPICLTGMRNVFSFDLGER